VKLMLCQKKKTNKQIIDKAVEVPCGYLPPMMGASKDDIESMISKQTLLPPLFTY